MASRPHRLSHRLVEERDLLIIATFVQSAAELFYCYPKASWPLTPAQLADAINHRRDSTVVLLNDEVVGFANHYQWQDDVYCALGNVMVSPNARGHGIARYLIMAMEEQARTEVHAKRMRLSCFNSNTAGLLLYSQLGYEPYAIVERESPDGQRVALIQMDKAL
ncbi:GNAT family N-acetyltransferase [Pseudomonas sp. EL_65y_Pfl2_R95]|uniref:GNAT family N-acetyltransferase n=1 Tax=Pseudomonas sp. EL_65y_Pfl2_R95 TaxID=3088698 RepID=UPI0030DD5F4E